MGIFSFLKKKDSNEEHASIDLAEEKKDVFDLKKEDNISTNLETKLNYSSSETEEEKIEDELNRKEIMMIAKYYLTDPNEKSDFDSFLFPEDKNLN